MAHRVKISDQVRRAVYVRDHWRCRYCGLQFDPERTWSDRTVAPYLPHPRLLFVFLELDHVHPLHHGGTDDPDNLCAACSPCNRRKSHHPVTTPQEMSL